MKIVLELSNKIVNWILLLVRHNQREHYQKNKNMFTFLFRVMANRKYNKKKQKSK